MEPVSGGKRPRGADENNPPNKRPTRGAALHCSSDALDAMSGDDDLLQDEAANDSGRSSVLLLSGLAIGGTRPSAAGSPVAAAARMAGRFPASFSTAAASAPLHLTRGAAAPLAAYGVFDIWSVSVKVLVPADAVPRGDKRLLLLGCLVCEASTGLALTLRLYRWAEVDTAARGAGGDVSDAAIYRIVARLGLASAVLAVERLAAGSRSASGAPLRPRALYLGNSTAAGRVWWRCRLQFGGMARLALQRATPPPGMGVVSPVTAQAFDFRWACGRDGEGGTHDGRAPPRASDARAGVAGKDDDPFPLPLGIAFAGDSGALVPSAQLLDGSHMAQVEACALIPARGLDSLCDAWNVSAAAPEAAGAGVWASAGSPMLRIQAFLAAREAGM
jgi:hypothetical protein